MLTEEKEKVFRSSSGLLLLSFLLVWVMGVQAPLTRNNVSGIHGIFVFDEAKPVHEFDLCNFSSAMRGKVRLNLGLGSCSVGANVSVDGVLGDDSFWKRSDGE